MRNYFKMQAMRWTSSNGDTLFAFGGDDEQLLHYVERMEEIFRGFDPAVTFTRFEPNVIWFELNEENFGRLLNGTGILDAFNIWRNTRLNDDPVYGSPPFFGEPTYYDMTRVLVEGSPRKTWSHGH